MVANFRSFRGGDDSSRGRQISNAM